MSKISTPVWSGEVAVSQRAIDRGPGLYHDLPADWRRNPSNHAPSASQGHTRRPSATGVRRGRRTRRADWSSGLPERSGQGVVGESRRSCRPGAVATYPSHRAKSAPTPVYVTHFACDHGGFAVHGVLSGASPKPDLGVSPPTQVWVSRHLKLEGFCEERVIELNRSSGRLNRSRREVTRVPEEVDPARAITRTWIVSPVEPPPATRRLPAAA